MSTPSEHQPYSIEDTGSDCEFCRIAANETPARVVYQDDDVIVIQNRLRWVPVMLLVMPKRHMSQEEMWQDPVIARIAHVAVQMGKEHCPEGFRLLSNFGHQAMQSQPHGHLHVLGGTPLGRYVSGHPSPGDR
ncbi:MAG: HIT domain-containing protein [Chloroflexi bacterium]|nr:HIT domain-containing protein [Chloroflexota bacterium]